MNNFEQNGINVELEDAKAHLEHLRSLSPADVKRRVRERVIGQDEAVSAFANQMFLMTQKRTALICGEDPNLLPRLSSICIVGPTASGKTFLTKEVSREMGFKQITIDCTTLTGTGWRGRDLNKALEPVFEWQQQNPGKFCVLLFDEADKMRMTEGDRESSFNPQPSFLTFLEETERYNINNDNDSSSPAKYIDMNYLIPVFAGAFTGIEEHVADRLSETNGGLIPKTSAYFTDSENARLRSLITSNDLVSFGMLSEFCGRVGQVINIEALKREYLEKIIHEGEYSLQRKFERMMPFGCGFVIDQSAVEYILDKTEETQLGVRCMESLLSASAAEARVMACENTTAEKIVLSYSDDDEDFVLTVEGHNSCERCVAAEREAC